MAAMLLVALYVPLAGGGPSIQRAGVMGIAGLVAALAGRPASRWYALGLAAAVTLGVNPHAAAEPGWQLSFATGAGAWRGMEDHTDAVGLHDTSPPADGEDRQGRAALTGDGLGARRLNRHGRLLGCTGGRPHRRRGPETGPRRGRVPERRDEAGRCGPLEPRGHQHQGDDACRDEGHHERGQERIVRAGAAAHPGRSGCALLPSRMAGDGHGSYPPSGFSVAPFRRPVKSVLSCAPDTGSPDPPDADLAGDPIQRHPRAHRVAAARPQADGKISPLD